MSTLRALPAPEERAKDAVDFAITLMNQQSMEHGSQQVQRTPTSSLPQAPLHAPHAPAAETSGHNSAPTMQYTQDDVEHLTIQYSRTGFRGIRSLPLALHPDFRMRLYGSLVALGKLWRTQQKERASRLALKTADSVENKDAVPMNLLAYGTLGPALQAPVLAGQTAPGPYSAFHHLFTIFGHGSSEYLAEKVADEEFRRLQRKLQLVPEDFVVTAMPPVPRFAMLFDEFVYMEDPYELNESLHRLEQMKSIQKRVGGRYVPGGKPHQKDLSKASLSDCLLQLHTGLSADWPLSFVQVFEDVPGNIVISFHKELAAQEGDITAYMSQHYRTNLTVQTFKLVKETNQWGLLADQNSEFAWGVYYVYWPPWAARIKVTPAHLAGPRPKSDGVSFAGPSTRDPFGKRTDAGLLTNYNTRSSERTMR